MTPQKPLVIGAPRSGFNLLIHVISVLQRWAGRTQQTTLRKILLYEAVTFCSRFLTSRYQAVFERHGLLQDLIFNGEFHLLVGGPKFLDKSNPVRMCVRKYLGIKGMGDFLFIVSHPREVFDVYGVVHSHSNPALWLQVPYYQDYRHFTSIRNPVGIINSSCFSLNAMASEYVQRFLPNADEDELRQRLALYKLTDLQFVRGLVKFLKDYLDEYLPVAQHYQVMRWENLITHPERTIQEVGKQLGLDVPAHVAAAIWKPMDHKNLLLHHKHNFRRGKGIVGDWKNSLVQEHIDIFREYDFSYYLKELGYPDLPEFNSRDYSPYQKLVARHIERGEIFRNTGDADLFGFAFNKTNIDASKFNFRSHPKRTHTHVERTTVTRDDVVQEVSDVIEEACNIINPMLEEIVSDQPIAHLLPLLQQQVERLLGSYQTPQLRHDQDRLHQRLRDLTNASQRMS